MIKINTAQNSSFHGLWSRHAKKESRYPCRNTIIQSTTYFYYPFSDEGQEEIDSVVLSNTRKSSYPKNTGLVNEYKEQKVKVMPKLDFTKADYMKYAALSKFLSSADLYAIAPDGSTV